jgi:hypothetical protein
MLIYDINLKEINVGDQIQTGEDITVLEQEGNMYYVKLGKKKYSLEQLSTYALSKNIVVLVDFEKVE